jgi:serine protease AprX
MKQNRFVTLARASAQVQNIATADSAAGDWPHRVIFRIWPDFEVYRQIDASTTTIKAVPTQRSFAAFGDGIVWAVIDSGIDGTHPHLAAGGSRFVCHAALRGQ